MIFGGLLAGGSGTRMETAVMPKQFLRVAGIPIFIRTLRTFLSLPEIDKVVVSINADWEETYIKLLDEFSIDTSRVVLIKGGDSRFTSLINIVKAAESLAKNEKSIIITHDCARLFVSAEILKDNISMIKDFRMVTTSLPTIDTLLYSEDGKEITSVPDRSKYFNDQGPQTFFVSEFLNYVKEIPSARIHEYIEAGKVYRLHNIKIGIVKGSRYNFKITNDIDLQYAEFLLEKGVVK